MRRQLVNEPTHITPTSQTVLHSDICTLDAISTSDHRVVLTSLSLKTTKPPSYTGKVWHYNNADFEGLNTMLRAHDWDFISSRETSVDQATEVFTDTLFSTAIDFIPYRTTKVNPNDKPFMIPLTKRLIRIRNRWNGKYDK